MRTPHHYRDLPPEELEEALSGFLLESWSYSKVTSFARNEKAFEMMSIYGCAYRSSATTVAGQAYHTALDSYFTAKKEAGEILDVVALEMIAFEYIEKIGANQWKIQKTTPTVQECKEKAFKTVTSLLRNFLEEIAIYEDEISEIISVELYVNEYLTINGVDIPLPCHMRIDLVVRLTNGKIAILDHKSKASFTPEEEMALSIGVQAITYANGYEAKTGEHVDEVWFIENKISKNKDNSPQLNCFKVSLTEDARRLYEALLYEPLRRMIQAVSDPDYVYLINDSDNFIDKAELYDFWARTMICEVEDFNVSEAKKELVAKRLRKIRDASLSAISPRVIKEFKSNASSFIQYDLSNKDMTQEQKIEHALRSFGTIVQVAHTFDGYSSDTYLLSVSAGVKISSIHNKKLDIANALDVPTVRISPELVVHEGKSYLGVETSKKRTRDLIFDPSFVDGCKLPIGKDNFENVIYWDTDNPNTPHVLVCGATGSGKTELLVTFIEGAKACGIDEIIIMDTKFSLKRYRNDPSVVTINDIEKIEECMANLVEEMERRVKTGEDKKILIIFDEFADALMNSRSGSELDIKEEVQIGNYAPKKGPFGFMMEGAPKMAIRKTGTLKSLRQNLMLLVQKGRSAGFRVVSATQRASVEIITGDTKVNMPVQICLRVPKEVDSKVVIDEGGAESLAGSGDALIKSPEYPGLVRFQSFYVPQNVTA